MSKSQQAVCSILTDFATKASNKTTLKMLSYDVHQGLVRGSFQVNCGSKDLDHKTIQRAVANTFGTKLQAVANTFKVVENGPINSTVTGYLAYTREVIPYSENLSGFKAFASNMYMDDDESIWTLKSTEAGQILVKSNAVEDLGNLNELLASNVVPASMIGQHYMSMSAVANSYETAPTGGDYIGFVCPKTERSMVGVVVASMFNEDGTEAGLYVQGTEGEAQVINPELVITKFPEVIEDPELDQQLASNSASIDIEQAVEYYRSLFRRNEQYAEQFIQRLRNHFI